MLRYDSPVQRTARVAMAETELAGTALTTGRSSSPARRRQPRPAVFDDPHTFDVARANAREHLAFSAGVHFCLGAALARLEGEIGLQTLFDRFPDLTLAGKPHPPRHAGLRGYDAIPVRLSRRSAAAPASSR